jgi:outer membrane receptor protein involved in Fe transport
MRAWLRDGCRGYSTVSTLSVYAEDTSMRLAVRFSLALALVALAAAYAPAWAQIETGRISGTVADTSGAVVPGVTVTAKSVNTGFTRETVSDTEGQYVFANITADTYEVTFALTGFRPAARRVNVSVGATVAVDVRLEVGGLTEQVQVVAVQETIDTRTGEFRTTVSGRQLTELPTLTRNPYDLVALSGNVREASSDEGALVGGEQGGRGTGFSINGQRTASTNILLDGGDNNYLFTSGIGQEIPLDAVQEFSVITNNFSPQYGRATGGIVNVVTKSGTNRFSGTAYEFFRNDELSSNSPENEARDIEKGNFRRNQLGYSFGGPIVRDRVHFFSSLEYIGIRSTDTLISWVVTPEFVSAINVNARNYFNTYGQGAVINGPTLTRAEVTQKLNIGDGAFNSLPANLPVFGRADVPLPTDAGGGFPQDNYQTINKVDFSLGNNQQASIAYAFLRADSEEGTQSASPYPQYQTGTIERKHNLNANYTRVWANNFTSQSKLVWNKLAEDQPINGVPEPRLVMNTGGVVRIDGNRIAFPGYLPFNPGSDIPAGGPQKLTQFYQDQTWLKGAHDIRFGGAFVHIADDHTFSAYSNAVEALSIAQNNTNSLNNLVAGNIQRFQKAINPNGFPGGTFVTPVQFPSFLSKNRYTEFALYAQDNWSIGDRLKLNLGMRYDYFGPQSKSDPKHDANFYYADVDLDTRNASPQEILASVRGGRVFESDESPVGGLWRQDKNNFAPRLGFAYDLTGDGRTVIRGGYGISYERNFGNVTYNVLFNPPLYLVTTIDAPTDVPSQPIYTDNAGPFGGVAGVTKTIPAGSLRHVDQNIKTAWAHIYGLAFQKELAGGVTGSIEYNGSSGRDLYDLADLNKLGAPLVYEGIGTATQRPNTQYSAFNTRGNRGRSNYHGLVFSADTRQLGDTGLALTSKYTLSRAKDNLSGTFSDADNNGYFQLGYLDAFDPMLDYGYAGFDVKHRFSASAIWSLPWANNNPWIGGWQVNALFTARSGYPFTVFDCTNAFIFCMRADDPFGVDRTTNSPVATGEPNEYDLLDLSQLVAIAGGYAHPLTGTTDFGPYPDTMTERNAFRGPGAWNVDFVVGKRFRFGNKAALIRLEAYNVFNHHNMYPRTDVAQVDSFSTITGFKDDWRRMQLGFKFEF